MQAHVVVGVAARHGQFLLEPNFGRRIEMPFDYYRLPNEIKMKRVGEARNGNEQSLDNIFKSLKVIIFGSFVLLNL